MDIETVKAAMETQGSSEWHFYRSYVGTALWSSTWTDYETAARESGWKTADLTPEMWVNDSLVAENGQAESFVGYACDLCEKYGIHVDDVPLDREHDESDLSDELRAAMKADCAAFYAANSELIHSDGAPLANDMDGPISKRESAMAGHDFWLTRCGHGAGFWDGDWPDDIGETLTQACKAFGNVDLYVSDQGEICS